MENLEKKIEIKSLEILKKLENFPQLKEGIVSEPLGVLHGFYFGYEPCCIDFFENRGQFKKPYHNPLNGTGCILCPCCCDEFKKNPQDYLNKINNNRVCLSGFPHEGNNKHAIEFKIYMLKKLGLEPIEIFRQYPFYAYAYEQILPNTPKIYLKIKNQRLENEKKLNITGFLLSAKNVVADFIHFLQTKNPEYLQTKYENLYYFLKYKSKRDLFNVINEENLSDLLFNSEEIKQWVADNRKDMKNVQKIKKQI